MFFWCQAHENQLEIERGVFNTHSFQILYILFYFTFFNKMDVLMSCRSQTEKSSEHNQSYSVEQLIPIIPTSCHPLIRLHHTEYDYMYRKNSVLKTTNFMTFYVYFSKVTKFLVKYLDLYKVMIKLDIVICFHSTAVHQVAV